MNYDTTFQFSLVIDDDLGEELCKFRNNESCNTRIVEKILHYYKNCPIFTTSDLMQRYYYDFPTILNTVLSNVTTPRINIDSSTAIDIAKHTIYKVVLCNDKSKKDIFPYIYIGGDRIENNFTATFFKNEPRQKALEHLRSLLESARCIFIYDLYLADNWASFISFAQKCFPQKLSIFYPKEIDSNNNANPKIPKLTQQQCSQIIQVGQSLWSFRPDRNHQSFSNLHDRYLIIDNKIEVIFTSGIHHLINTDKDFTYIVRQLSHK